MRNNDEWKGNIVRIELLNPDGILELVENVFSHHQNTLECSTGNGSARFGSTGYAWRIEITKMGSIHETNDRGCVILLMNMQLREEWMCQASELLS